MDGVTAMSEKVEVNLIEAINTALAYELEHDKDLVVLGEDVGHNGGVFRATDGLQDKFGFMRVMDTPLAETLITGVSIGMAAQGLKPVAEIQFMGFMYSCMEQLICHAARLRNRTRGRLHCPLVIRAPYGGGIGAPEHHSESTEALLAHIPGLRVVIPSSAQSAYGLLLAAIRCPDPVIFLEPKRIYRAVKCELENNGKALRLDESFVLRSGSDVTLISWGAMMQDCIQVTHALSREGVDIELIDLASISPLDMGTILGSVKKTGRCVIVHEATRSFGVGAEIAARLAEQEIGFLRAPIQRVCAGDTIMPYFRMEKKFLPDMSDIRQAVFKAMEGS
jgi:2-oxoisovalerate dehydrogenase E1 component beta subunit